MIRANISLVAVAMRDDLYIALRPLPRSQQSLSGIEKNPKQHTPAPGIEGRSRWLESLPTGHERLLSGRSPLAETSIASN